MSDYASSAKIASAQAKLGGPIATEDSLKLSQLVVALGNVTSGGGGGSGDVVGPASSTDNALTRFNGITGKLIQNSTAILDDAGNLTLNNVFTTSATTVSAGGTTILTVNSARYQQLTGTLSQTFQLPDATTVLGTGQSFQFNNNSSGSLIITNNAGTTLYTAPAGGYAVSFLTDKSTANGVWDFHAQAPATVTWGSGTTGLVFNTALTTSPSISAGISSAANPSFIPQRGSATTGFGGDSTHLYGSIGGVAAFTSTAASFGVPALAIRSSGAAFDLTLATSEVLTAGRTLSFVVNDAARTLTLSGNPTLSGVTITGAGTIATGGFTLTVPATGTAALLGRTNVFSIVQNITFGIASATKADGLVLTNSTAATNGNQTYSPNLTLVGNQWASGASRAYQWSITTIPVQQDYNHCILQFATKAGVNASQAILNIRDFNQAIFIESANTGTALTIGSTGGNGVTNIQVNAVNQVQFGAGIVTFSDAVSMVFNTTTGTKIGTTTGQKIGFWNATPIIQPTTAVAASTFVTNTSGIINDTGTWDGYTIGQVVKALRNTGLLA